MRIGVVLSPANTLIVLQRLHSFAFGCGTFAYAKDQASLPLDGLLKDYPTPQSKTTQHQNVGLIIEIHHRPFDCSLLVVHFEVEFTHFFYGMYFLEYQKAFF
jgi:hypothetical protein